MRRLMSGFALAAIALLMLGGDGCSRQRRDRLYNDVVGRPATVDLNTASRSQLASLPGLTDADADKIIANRPYGAKEGLLRKKVLGQQKYDAIQDYVYVARGGQY